MDFKRSVKIELTTCQNDWIAIRECYVKSFYRYPLYKYMVPDESKREAFLRAYLDANYEVTVGSGQGILLAIRVPEENHMFANHNAAQDTKIVGGVVFVPPSIEGGWAMGGSEEPYWKAYVKHGLAKISKKGLERAIRYEAWENEQVAQRASLTHIPLWNGFFCAIAPEYACKGLGSAVYKEAIRIMARYWTKQQNSIKEMLPKVEKEERNTALNRLVKNISLSHLHRYTLLSHRAIPLTSEVCGYKTTSHIKASINVNKPPTVNDTSNKAANDIMFNVNAPLVVAVSHSDKSSHFHQTNGFHPVSRIPYHDAIDGVTPFFAHVLALDPFRTGKLEELITGLRQERNFKEDISPCIIYNGSVQSGERTLIE